MTDETKTSIWIKIHARQEGTRLSGEEREQLTKLLQTPLMHKVLGTIYGLSRDQANQFLSVDFSDPVQCHQASQVQGHVRASIGLIDMMMALTDDDEKEDEDGN